MKERETDFSIQPEKLKESVFANPFENAPSQVISLLRLAEREGAYHGLSEKTQQRLKMYYVEGLNIVQIADVHNVSKQAISQTLRNTPEILYKKMTKDVIHRKTFISFREILAAYSDYRIYLDSKNY